VERTRLLVHVLDGLAGDPVEAYDAIQRELGAFSEALIAKPQIVVLNKMDLPDVREIWPLVRELFAERGIEVRAISAVAQEGVRELLWEIAQQLEELPAEPLPEPEPVLRPDVDEKAFTIRVSEKGWHVYGVAIERTAQMTNWSQYESAARFQRVLEAMGITMALREAGVQEGDTVYIGNTELEWGWQDIA
jgi:GTP-binding protein